MPHTPELVVRDCMHVGVIACAPEAGLEEVAAIMRERDISAVVVMAGDAPLGVISKTDLVNASFIQPYMRYWRGMAARHLMSSPVVSIRADAPVTEAVALLESRRIHRLLVTEATGDGEQAVGVLSVGDIARVLGTPAPAAQPARGTRS